MQEARTPYRYEYLVINKAPRNSDAIRGAVLSLTGTHHLAQLVFLGEFTREDTQVLDQLMAGSDYRLLRGDLAISLDAELKLRDQGMRHL